MLKPIQHIIIFAVFAMGCAKSPSSADPSAIRMLVASLPNTLNPRTALDQASQKILAAVYPSVIEPSAPHTVSPDGKRWRFKAGLVAPAENLAECLKEYQTGEPPSAFRDVFKDVAAIEAQGGELAITLKRPNPDFADEATGVRFFRQPGRLACQDPVEGQPITSPGPYRIGDGRYASAIPERRLDLVPNPLTADGLSPLSIYFVKDENTRALRILRGEIDAAWTAISLAKERWIERELTRDFTHQEVHGSSVSYLAFNLNDPILRDVRVRRAIAAAIDKRAIIEQKLYGFCDPASSFLPPDHPDLLKASFPYDPARARAWLDEAGYPARDGKPRFTLKYKTTPVREGIEFSQMVRH
ncbi:MAG: ABC transporter substrate-binding protein, partial [Bacteriovoracia bacterium]